MGDSYNDKEFSIRKAKPDDVPAMMQLIKELAVYEHAPKEVTVSEERFLESGFGESPIWYGFVAEAAGKVFGMALYYLRYSTWKGPMMYLEDLVVTNEWRKRGVGRKLIEKLIATAKEKNLAGVTWQVLDWNEDAIQFYKGLEGIEFDESWINCKIKL